MNAFHEEVLRKAGEFVAELRARFDREDIDEAAGLVVTITDPDSLEMRCHGPFPDPIAAIAWAQSYTGVLNEALPGGAPLSAGVHLLFNPRV